LQSFTQKTWEKNEQVRNWNFPMNFRQLTNQLQESGKILPGSTPEGD
jgi:hypothetical protein